MNTLEIQKALKAAGFNPGELDGRPGDNTRKAVIAFQQAVGLVPDGKAGRQTQAALKQTIAPVKPGKVEPDKSAMLRPLAPAEGAAYPEGAAPPPNLATLRLLDTVRPVREIIWHCTATAEGKDYSIADIRAWHKARGFSDIGYHYVIQRNGRIDIGRPIGQIGAHVEGHNSDTIGCSYIGGVAADGKTPKDTRTPAQRASMLWLTRELKRKFPKISRVSGHNQYAAKACPSFDVRKDRLSTIA